MILADFSDKWKDWFQNEKAKLAKLFNEEIAVIEHVGSTSIPNQNAKPIVDIFVGVKRLRNKNYYRNRLGKEYEYVETGMRGRFLFHKKHNSGEEYNVHFLPNDEEFPIRNEILFRDYLCAHPELVVEYSAIKEKLMKEYGPSFDYTYGKTQFIQTVVDRARLEKGLELRNVWE